MIIKARAVPRNVSATQLRQLEVGNSLSLGLIPDKGEAATIEVFISAIELRKLLVRIEGYTEYQGRTVNVITQIFTSPEREDEGYAELTVYP